MGWGRHCRDLPPLVAVGSPAAPGGTHAGRLIAAPILAVHDGHARITCPKTKRTERRRGTAGAAKKKEAADSGAGALGWCAAGARRQRWALEDGTFHQNLLVALA